MFMYNHLVIKFVNSSEAGERSYELVGWSNLCCLELNHPHNTVLSWRGWDDKRQRAEAKLAGREDGCCIRAKSPICRLRNERSTCSAAGVYTLGYRLYCCCHLCQIRCWKAWTRCQQLRRRLSGVVWKSASGTATKAVPIKILILGVKPVRSKGTLESGVRSLEFNIASTCVVRVVNSARVRTVSPITRRKWYFEYFMAASQRPH